MNVGGVVNLNKVPKRNTKVMLKEGYVVNERYNGRKFISVNEDAKGKILTVRDTASEIFDTFDRVGVLHHEWVDELKDVSNDTLVTAVIMGGLSEEEYTRIRRERG